MVSQLTRTPASRRHLDHLLGKPSFTPAPLWPEGKATTPQGATSAFDLPKKFGSRWSLHRHLHGLPQKG